jgi:hypothetical protein
MQPDLNTLGMDGTLLSALIDPRYTVYVSAGSAPEPYAACIFINSFLLTFRCAIN